MLTSGSGGSPTCPKCFFPPPLLGLSDSAALVAAGFVSPAISQSTLAQTVPAGLPKDIADLSAWQDHAFTFVNLMMDAYANGATFRLA